MIALEETDERFYIAESSLPDAGLGVFAKVKIHKHDYLEIIGVLVKYGGTADQCTHYANRYKFAGEQDLVHALVPMGYAAIINQANSKEQQNVSITHLPDKVNHSVCQGKGCNECDNGLIIRYMRNSNAGAAVYVAIRDIEPGEELLGNYNKKIGQLSMKKTFSEEDKRQWLKFISQGFYGLNTLID